ncbi:MAG: GTPase Era [Bacillota bacterium]|nr:GTPase Era [Bacillota bacterium]
MKSGFVTIMGKPNVGKSTLLNRMIGEKIAAISQKPQTTRNKIAGIYNSEDSQIVFLDTPGVHSPNNRLGEFMMESVKRSLDGIDILLYMVDDEFVIPKEEDALVIPFFNMVSKDVKIFVIVNKTDKIPIQKFGKIKEYFEKHERISQVIGVSALEDRGVKTLIDLIKEELPEGIAYYSDEIYTDISERDIVCEILREKLLKYMDDEIPHGTAVSILQFSEREEKAITDIEAEIICEKDSHKGIIIGKKGRKLKGIASAARKDIEEALGIKVNLQVWVKVKPNWRDSPGELKRRGYDIRKL